ncbi:MAG: hypothetical protein R2851_16760 [Caldilineaceae bacterium]
MGLGDCAQSGVAAHHLIESFAVTHVDEDGTPVQMASYWINLSALPTTAR